jgi:hypothetical protein
MLIILRYDLIQEIETLEHLRRLQKDYLARIAIRCAL